MVNRIKRVPDGAEESAEPIGSDSCNRSESIHLDTVKVHHWFGAFVHPIGTNVGPATPSVTLSDKLGSSVQESDTTMVLK